MLSSTDTYSGAGRKEQKMGRLVHQGLSNVGGRARDEDRAEMDVCCLSGGGGNLSIVLALDVKGLSRSLKIDCLFRLSDVSSFQNFIYLKKERERGSAIINGEGG